MLYWNQRCEDLARSTIEAAWHCGRALIDVKAKRKHGEFGNWLKKVRISKDKASRYMKIAREIEISHCAKFGSLREALLSLASGDEAEAFNQEYQEKVGQPIIDAMNAVYEYRRAHLDDDELLIIWARHAPQLENDGSVSGMKTHSPDHIVKGILTALKKCLEHIHKKPHDGHYPRGG